MKGRIRAAGPALGLLAALAGAAVVGVAMDAIAPDPRPPEPPVEVSETSATAGSRSP